MITYDNIINEGYSGLTKRDVGRGYGGLIGGTIGAVGSIPLVVHGINNFNDSLKQPDVETDFSDHLLRNGLIFSTFPALALGKYIGGKIGEATVKDLIKDPEKDLDEKSAAHRVGALYSTHAKGLPAALSSIPYLGGVAVGGTNIYNSYADKGVANKLGYGDIGKLSNAFILGPLTGLTTPEKLRDKRK